MSSARRTYGTGSVFTDRGKWYGQFWRDGRQVKRALGPKRTPGTRDGLTRKQAESELRRRMNEATPPRPHERVTVATAGARYLRHLKALGRKRSTLEDYGSHLRVHLGPYFGDKPLDKIGTAEVEAFMAAEAADGKAAKSILNYVGLLHSIFAYAERRGWRVGNPCKLVDKPRAGDGDPRIRFLDQAELEALLRATPNSRIGHVDRAMYLTAAMTGLRQGELLALRWRDVDWAAGKVRVLENYVRGEFGSPKSRRSIRSVPLAVRVAAELERLFQRSSFQDDDDLVFCHPQTGGPMERSRLLKRFKLAVGKANVGQFVEVERKGKLVRKPLTRFHDLRHTFGTRLAGAGVPLRTLQEFLGHRDFKTTLIYADYQPSERDAELVERAFGETRTNLSTNLSASGHNSEQENVPDPA